MLLEQINNTSNKPVIEQVYFREINWLMYENNYEFSKFDKNNEYYILIRDVQNIEITSNTHSAFIDKNWNLLKKYKD